MSAAASRPWWHVERSAPGGPVLPAGVVVPDLSVKRSLVLDRWNAEQRAARGQRIQAQRLQIQQRAYEGAASNRLTADWLSLNTSADSELVTSLRPLRARSRQLVRDNGYARHIVRQFRTNVIGNGIGMQAVVKSAGGKLQTAINDSIEAAWDTWADKRCCHTAGLLGFTEIEQLAVVQLVTAGEFIARKHRRPFGPSNVPFALEVIEADLLLDNWQAARAPNGNLIRMGVEIDEWHRPIAYWFSPQHPGDYQFTTFEPSRFVRVPADEIIHLHVIDRWPQTRGEPWFHAAVTRLHAVGAYEESTIVKARASANICGFIRSAEPLAGADAVDGAGRQLLDTEPGTWQKLLPGEDVAGFSPAIADANTAPFLRHMLTGAAISVGLSYEGMTRDYQGANYNTLRVGQLEDRDLYRVIQGFVIRNLRADVHREFTDAAALVAAIKTGADYFSNPGKYQAVRFKPRGWSWVDPMKEVNAYRIAVRSGFMLQGDVIEQAGNGADFEDLVKGRAAELEMAAEHGLVFDTNPAQVNEKGLVQPTPAAAADEDTAPAAPGSEPGDEPTTDTTDQE